MALRKIVTVGDPILTKVCRPVTRFDQKLAILIEDMIETMHNANGVGLAGPQVGVMRRLCVVDTPRSSRSARKRRPAWRAV